MSKYQVVARRYRPQTFAEILGQEAIVTTLKNAILHKRLAHAYLFCGSRGTGKTTFARVFAKALNCEHPTEQREPCNQCSCCKEITAGTSLEVLEIDGASHRGIDDIRQINETVGYSTAAGKYKIYIIDEVHMLTKEAFNALLKTLEEPPENVKFFFATTEPHKIPATILSRCQRFNLNRIPLQSIVNKLKMIVEEQGLLADEEALHAIASRAEGGLRDAESLLDQIMAFHEGTITADSVATLLGIMPRQIFFTLDKASQEGNLAIAFEIANQVFSQGKDLLYFIDLLTEHFRNILLVKLSGKEAPFLTLSALDRNNYEQSAKLYTQEECLTIIDFLIEAQNQIRYMPSGRIALEALLLRILRIHQRISVDFLVRRLVELEKIMSEPSSSLPKAISAPQSVKQEAAEQALQNKAPSIEPFKIDSVPISTAKPLAPDETKSTADEKQLLLAKTETSMTEDPTPSPQDLGIKIKTQIQKTENKKENAQGPAITSPLNIVDQIQESSPTENPTIISTSLEVSTEPQTPTAPSKLTFEPKSEAEITAAKKRQSRYDTLLQFAAIELEGSLQKKQLKGI